MKKNIIILLFIALMSFSLYGQESQTPEELYSIIETFFSKGNFLKIYSYDNYYEVYNKQYIKCIRTGFYTSNYLEIEIFDAAPIKIELNSKRKVFLDENNNLIIDNFKYGDR